MLWEALLIRKLEVYRIIFIRLGYLSKLKLHLLLLDKIYTFSIQLYVEHIVETYCENIFTSLSPVIDISQFVILPC